MKTIDEGIAEINLYGKVEHGDGEISVRCETDAMNRTMLVRDVDDGKSADVLVGTGEGVWEYSIEEGDFLMLYPPGGRLSGEVDFVGAREGLVILKNARWEGVFASLENGISGAASFAMPEYGGRISTSCHPEPITFHEYKTARNLVWVAETKAIAGGGEGLWGKPERNARVLARAIKTVVEFGAA